MALFRRSRSPVAKPVRVAILMPWGRVGSNLLMSMLMDSFVSSYTRLANEPLNRITDANGQAEWLRDFYGTDSEALKLIASKHAWHAFADPDQMADAMEEHGLSLVRMRRSNIVKVAISQMRAEMYAARWKTDDGYPAWGVAPGKPTLGQVALDPEKFVETLRVAASADAGLQAFNPECPIFDIEYDAVKASPQQKLSDVLSWLELEAERKAQLRFAKATPDDLASAVPNLDDLREATEAAGLGDFTPMFDR